MLQPLTADDRRRIGPYELKSRIGAGGMGVVFLGFDDQHRPAAVKVPGPLVAADPAARRRFRDEVAAARRVRGRSIAAVLACDLDADPPWLASEYVEGVNLADAVAQRGAFTGRLLDGLAVGLADALVAIHAAGVVHRDLKPANVLLAWDGPKVVDFGIARTADATSHTATGAWLGTPVWMAPEQWRGERADPPADVFAWGACMAYAATGRPPFRGALPADVGVQITTGEPDLDGVPEPLLGVVRQALSKDPNDRPAAPDLLARVTGSAGVPGASDVPGAVGAVGRSAALTDSGQLGGIPVDSMLARLWSLPGTPPARLPLARSSKPRRRAWLKVLVATAAVLVASAGAVLATGVLDRGAQADAGDVRPSSSSTSLPGAEGPETTPLPDSSSPPAVSRSPDTTPALSGGVPVPDRPADQPASQPARDGDVDGDGEPDVLTLVTTGTLRVDYSSGGSDEVTFGIDDPDQRVLGAVDADADGYAEVFVQASTAAAARSDAVFRFVRGELELMTTDGSTAALLHRVGSLGSRGAWACGTDDFPIVTWSSSSTDGGTTFTGQRSSYSFDGSRMVLEEELEHEEVPVEVGVDGVPTDVPVGCGSLVLGLS